MRNVKTVRLSANGFFSINDGVDIDTALKEASNFLDIARDEASQGEAWAAAYMIDLAKGLIDSVVSSLMEGAVANEGKTTSFPFFLTHMREVEYLFSVNSGIDIESALQQALFFLINAQPDAKDSDVWTACALIEMSKAIVESSATALSRKKLSLLQSGGGHEHKPSTRKNTPELTPDDICQAVEVCFGRSPKRVVGTLHRAVEGFNWMGELFGCIEEANADGYHSQGAARIHALASLGAYVAGDYQLNIIGEPATEMQDCIEAALKVQS